LIEENLLLLLCFYCLLWLFHLLLYQLPLHRAFINAVPNPVGVNQQTLLHVGIKHPLTNTNEGWSGLTVTVTRPDGVVETLNVPMTDSTGGTGVIYVPTMAGNYTLVTNFPQQTLPTSTSRPFSTPAGTTMLASSSAPLTLVVTEAN